MERARVAAAMRVESFMMCSCRKKMGVAVCANRLTMGDALAKELFGSAEEENQAGNQLRGDNHGEEAEEDQGQKAKAGFFRKIGGPGSGRRSQGDQGGKNRGNRVFHLLLLVAEKFRTVASLI